MIDRLWKLLFGYVTIQADGLMLERFLNACESAKIPLTALKRVARLRLTAHVCVHHNRRLFRIAEQTRCEITVLSAHGLYAMLLRLFKRPVILVCLVLALIAGMLSSRFVLDIRVSGVKGERAARVLQAADQCGVRRWALWSALEQGVLQRELEKSIPFAQKVLVHKRGVMMDIEVIPYVEGPPLFKNADVCDIIAFDNAVVESVIALDGTPVVSRGDVVRQGDVLIRGTFMRNVDEGKQRFVQARGVVIGRVSYKGFASVSLTAQSYQLTGREQQVRTISIALWKIPLSDSTSFAQSILVKQTEEAIVGNVLPASITTKTYAEIKPVSAIQSYSQAEALAIAYAKAQAQKKMPLNCSAIRQTVYSELTEDGNVDVYVYLTTLLPIGIENRQMMQDPLLYIPKYW